MLKNTHHSHESCHIGWIWKTTISDFWFADDDKVLDNHVDSNKKKSWSTLAT